MLLYEIDAALAALLDDVDEETGELRCRPEDLDRLMMDRQDALEGIALQIKNLDAEAGAIREEEKNLADRRRAMESKADKLRAFLQEMLAGETIKTARVAVSYRRSKAVNIDPERFFMPDNEDWFRYKEPEANKQLIAAALKNGTVIPGATLVNTEAMTIK